MPQVTKQAVRPIAKLSTGFASRVQDVSEIEHGMKILIYGRSKTGKTSLACDFPKPILLVGTEDGTESVKDMEDVKFGRLIASAEMDEVLNLLKTEDYRTVILDTAGGFQDIIVKEVLDLDEVPVQRTYGMGQSKFKDDRQMWGVVGLQFKERMRRLLDLADTQGINVVIVAHERNFNDEGGSELITPTVGAALTPSAAGFLNGACDYICQCFLREIMTASETKVGDKKIKTFKKTGKAEYGLRIGPHPVYTTGFRISRRLSEALPDVIINPTYEEICKLAGR